MILNISTVVSQSQKKTEDNHSRGDFQHLIYNHMTLRVTFLSDPFKVCNIE